MVEKELPVGQVVGAISALCGFAVALIAGMAAGNPADTVILRALVAMFVCALVGRAVGAAGFAAIRSHIETFREANPVPEPAPRPGEIVVDEAEPEGDVIEVGPAGEAEPAAPRPAETAHAQEPAQPAEAA